MFDVLDDSYLLIKTFLPKNLSVNLGGDTNEKSDKYNDLTITFFVYSHSHFITLIHLSLSFVATVRGVHGSD